MVDVNAVKRVCPPEACPPAYAAQVGLVDGELMNIFKNIKVPWYIVYQLADPTSNCTSTIEFAHRYRDLNDARDNAKTELGFKEGENGYTKAMERTIESRLVEAWNQANTLRAQRADSLGRRAEDDPTLIMVPGERESMRRIYKSKEGMDPNKAEEGSDWLLGNMSKDIRRGELGAQDTKQITSKIPDVTDFLYPITDKGKTKDNALTEVTHMVRKPPTTWEAWKRQMKVFRTSLLMVIWCYPSQTHLQITKQNLDDFYDFIYGPDVTGRDNPPSLNVIMRAERLAWRRIALEVCKTVDLKAALTKLMGNNLFWQHEVLDKCGHGYDDTNEWLHQQEQSTPKGKGGWKGKGKGRRRRNGKGKGKGKTYGKTKGVWQNQTKQTQPWNVWRPSSKGKGKGKGKAKSSGKAGWASKDTKGTFYCWDFHEGKCNRQDGQCWNSHRCPVIVGNGQGCNKKHKAWEH